MFCYQCEQTAKGTGCTVMGVCGKSAEVSDLQDLLIHAAKGIAMYAHRARGLGAVDGEIDRFVVEALFTTVTNVNFDNIRMAEMITQAGVVRSKARKLYENACARAGRTAEPLSGPAADQLPESMADMAIAGGQYTPRSWAEKRGDVVQGLYEIGRAHV